MSPILTLSMILAGAILLFATEWVRADLVALLVLAALVLTGILSPEAAVMGFSNPATVTVGCMFVLSAALDRSGALDPLSAVIGRFARGRPLLLSAALMLTAGAASAFINNTAVVAIFLPATMAIARDQRISASKLLIPVSFASQFGGVCTLIGTSTNLVVSSVSADAGLGAFGMFEMTVMGVVLFVAGVVLMLVLGHWLLPARKDPGEAIDDYDLRDYLAEIEVREESPLVGRSPLDADVEAELGVQVIEIVRQGRRLVFPTPSDVIRAGDLLMVEGSVKRLLRIREKEGIELKGDLVLHDADFASGEVALFEGLVVPASPLVGRSLKALDFRRRYGLNALAIRRTGAALREKVAHVRLRVGDALLLQGRSQDVEALKSGTELLVLGPISVRSPRRRKTPLAVLIMVGVVAAAGLGAPIVGAALLGSVLMVVTGCLTLEETYEAIDWRIVFLLAGVLPLGQAMSTTGAADQIAHGVLIAVGSWGPVAALAALYLITMLLTSVMSNNSAAAILAPIGIATAVALGVSPKPFLMAVCFAGSTCFLTPIGYQTNMMVYAPGAYRFWDFARVGWPLDLAFWIVSVLLIPLLWPF